MEARLKQNDPSKAKVYIFFTLRKDHSSIFTGNSNLRLLTHSSQNLLRRRGERARLVGSVDDATSAVEIGF